MPFRPAVTLLLIAAAAPLAFGTAAVTQPVFFDAIADAVERDAFRAVWDTRAPAEQRGLAERFVARFPASIVLREAYELAAHASVAAGDAGAAMTWAERSLRILPENPSLLVLAADLSARRGDLAAAERRARLALEILARADAPAPLSADEWNRVRDGHRAIAHTILARAAAARRDYPAASDELLAALALNRTDADALYLLGVVRAASGDHRGGRPRAQRGTAAGRREERRREGPARIDLCREPVCRWPDVRRVCRESDVRAAGGGACRCGCGGGVRRLERVPCVPPAGVCELAADRHGPHAPPLSGRARHRRLQRSTCR